MSAPQAAQPGPVAPAEESTFRRFISIAQVRTGAFNALARLIIRGCPATFLCLGHLAIGLVTFVLVSCLSYNLCVPATNYFSGSKPQAPAVVKPGDALAVDPRMLPPANLQLGWELNQKMDMHVYLSTSPNGDVFSQQWTSGGREDHDKDLPHFVWENLTFGNWKDSRIVELDVKFPWVRILLCVRSALDFYSSFY